MLLTDWLTCLAISEALHPKFGIGCTCVSVQRRSRLHNKEKVRLQKELVKCGEMVKFYSQERKDGSYELKAAYDYMTHAYLAKLLVDGVPADGERCSVEVVEKEKEKMLL